MSISGNRASVLVTGGAGYVGSHVVLALLDEGYGVVVLDNLSTGCRWAVDQRAAFFEGDVENGSLVRTIMEMHGIAAVLQLAGKMPDADGVGDPLAFYRGNSCATRSLIENAIACGVPCFLYSSTAETCAPLADTVPQLPAQAYAMSKRVAERMLIDAAGFHPLNTGILRYFHAAGADPQGRCGKAGTSGASSHFLQQALETVLGKRRQVDIVLTANATPDGSLVRDYIHVSDVAAAHVALLGAMLDGRADGLALDCSYGRGMSQREIIAMVEQVTNVRIARREIAATPGIAPALHSDGLAMAEALGWHPRHASLEAIVRDAFRWEMQLQRMSAGDGPGTPPERAETAAPANGAAARFTPHATTAIAARPLRP